MNKLRYVWGTLCLIIITTTLMVACGDEGGSGTGSDVGKPEINSVSPTRGFVGDPVTINADGLVPQPEENIVRFNGKRAVVESVSSGQLTTSVPEGASSGTLTLSVVGGTTKGPFFTVLTPTPTITSVEPRAGRPGTRVTITGTNFGGEAASGDVAGTVMPSGPAPDSSRTLIGGSLFGESNLQSAASDTTDTGDTVSDSHDDITVTVGGVEAVIISRTPTQIVIEIPEGADDGPIRITRGGQSADSEDIDIIFDVVRPSITSINPTSGMPGTAVTISGENFGATAAENTVTFGGAEAEVTSASEDELIATVPDNAATGPVEVTTDGQTATGPDFSVRRNQAPSITSEASFEVAENATSVGTVTANDPDGDDLSFSLSSGDDQDQFSIDASSGALTFADAPDFESPGDANEDNIYDVQVQVSDGTASATQDVTVMVTDVNENEAPSITSDASFEVAENTTTVATITATDPNGDELTFSLSGGDDQERFAINGTSGALSFNAAPDFENPADANEDNAYKVQVSASDGAQTAMQNITVTVTDVDENQAPSITSSSTFDVAENTTSVGTVTATDPNDDELIFTLSGGDDAGAFIINESSGALAFSAAPDFENPGDANGDNKFQVQVQASDGTQAATQNITVTVTNVYENGAPTITSDAAFEIPENTTAVGTVTATDPNKDDLAFSISGGADQDQFTIDGTTGELAFNTAPDFENPGDANTDNKYAVSVQVSDGAETASQTITVTVTDVTENQSPSITSDASFEVEENMTGVGTISATDPDGDALTFTLSGGDDQDQFSINAGSGALTFTEAPDFENPADANTDNVYTVQVQVSDGTETASQDVTVTVTDVDENQAPSITSDASFEVAENTTAVATITATDPNSDELSFSISGGDDAGAFTIDGATGELAFETAPDFENPGDANEDNAYLLQVQASDGTQSATQNITVSVTDVDENVVPVITSDAGFSVEENTTAVGTVTANDANADELSFSISGGDDADAFSIDGSTGELAFETAPDFENPGDANTDNEYLVTVQVSDGAETVTQDIIVTVTDVDENQPPTITSGSSFTVDENTTTVTALTATDPNSDDLVSFTVSGGADQSLFAVDSGTESLIFRSAPDFENPGDANTDNVYEVQVEASDGTENVTQDITVTVTNVNEGGPTITSDATFTVDEGTTTVTTVTATDPDGDALTFSISGGDDQDAFTIGGSSGELAFSSAPDADNPTDSNTDNDYIVEVQVSDGTITANQTLTITVPLFAGGDGSSGNPYQIANLAQLQRVQNDLNGHYEQIANIDASATQNGSYGDGNGFSPIGKISPFFTGSYDGAGFTISGLTINRPNTTYVGLFGVISNGPGVKNVQLTNVNITGETNTGALVGTNAGTISGSSAGGSVTGTDQNTGGLVGTNAGSGSITRSSSSSTVSGTIKIGGLAGYNESSGSITTSYATGNVTGTSDETGGLVGENQGTIDNTYATGDVSGGNDPGGLVGVNDNTVRRSYAVGAVTGDIHPGGLNGSDDFTDDSYWDIETTGQSSSDGGRGLYTSEMIGSAAQSNMVGFDFSSVWTTNASFYPTLRDNPQPNLPVITPNQAPNITSGTSFTATEGETAVTTITANDPENDDLTFYVIGGDDQGLFTIDNSNGALAFRTAPDADNPADSNTDNEYQVEVQVTDGSRTDSKILTITVPLYAGGDGTSGNPYQVSTLTHLQRVQENLSASYIQTADIDASATANGSYGDGNGFAPIGTFIGSYDGDGFSIDGLNIRRQTESTTSNMGLFGTIDGATITDVILTNVNIQGKNFTGGLVGEVNGSGTITGSSVSGEVRGRNDTGGLVGNLNSGTITESYFYGSIYGEDKAGGLVATVQSGSSINRSYAKMVEMVGFVGPLAGLVAQNAGTIRNSYVNIIARFTNSDGTAGGLVATNSGTIENSFVTIGRFQPDGSPSGGVAASNSGTITNSYYNADQIGSSDGGTGLTTAEMQGSAADTNMDGFDFSTIWQTVTGDYPILRGVGGQ